MTTQPQISVIIPVYNASEYLTECLESLLKQTFINFEAICINDGSVDDSLAILQKYQRQDARIKIYSQENQGTSKARELAVSKAKGVWIAYLDADDYLASDYLQKLYDKAQADNSDAVYCYYYEDRKGYLFPHKKKIKTFKISEFGKISYITGACKLIKKKILQKVCFPKNCSFGEDGSVSMQVALQRPKISLLKKYLYFYRRHNGSTIMSQKDVYKNLAQLLQAYRAAELFAKKENIFTPEVKKFLYQKMEKQIIQEIRENAS